MKITYENNTVTIDTEVKASVLEDAKNGVLTLKDDKGNDVFALAKVDSPCAISQLTEKVMPVNAVSAEGNALLVAVMPTDVELKDIKKMYGAALVAAKNAVPQIAADAIHFAEEVNALFTEVAE